MDRGPRLVQRPVRGPDDVLPQALVLADPVGLAADVGQLLDHPVVQLAGQPTAVVGDRLRGPGGPVLAQLPHRAEDQEQVEAGAQQVPGVEPVADVRGRHGVGDPGETAQGARRAQPAQQLVIRAQRAHGEQVRGEEQADGRDQVGRDEHRVGGEQLGVDAVDVLAGRARHPYRQHGAQPPRRHRPDYKQAYRGQRDPPRAAPARGAPRSDDGGTEQHDRCRHPYRHRQPEFDVALTSVQRQTGGRAQGEGEQALGEQQVTDPPGPQEAQEGQVAREQRHAQVDGVQEQVPARAVHAEGQHRAPQDPHGEHGAHDPADHGRPSPQQDT